MSGPNIRGPRETPEMRAEIIAGLRAMAQFLEDHPLVPCPQRVDVQHSYLEPLDLDTFKPAPAPDAEKIAFVQSVAALLDAEAEVDEGNAVVQHAVAPRTTYVVHATLRGGEQA